MLRKCILQRALAFNYVSPTPIPCGFLPTLSRLLTFPSNEGNNIRLNSHSSLARNIFPEAKELLTSSVLGSALQVRNYAARKGTREKREKLKKKRKKEKIEVVKLSFLQRRKLSKQAATIYRIQSPVDYSHLGHPVDDVYFYHKYDEHQWDFAEAVQNHRETHHPSMLNRPNCPLLLRIHLNFQYPNRPNKQQDGWRSVVEMKQPFLLPGMVAPTVIAFCPNEPSLIEEAIEAGADLAGGMELIKKIQGGHVSLNDFEYILAHPLLITELTVIRGLMKKKFPNVKAQTLDVDIPRMVQQFKAGMKVQGCKTEKELHYGWVEAPIGTLDMDIAGMEGNFEAILADTLTHRVPGKTAETFILGCVLKTSFSFERFKLKAEPYILKHDKRPIPLPNDSSADEVKVEDESEDSEETKVAKAQVS